jgi:ABC-type transport system substrate-binding protein
MTSLALGVAGIVGPDWASAATQSTPAAQPVRGGTLRIALQSDPEIFDPTQVFATAIWKAVEHIYDTLVRIDTALNPIPGLAESWEISADRTVYTFHLRPNVIFHDGTPLTADDVRFTYTRILDPVTIAVNRANFLSIKGAVAYSKGETSTLDGIRVIDPLTIEITLEEPDASFLSVLASGGGIILSRAFVEAHGGDISQAVNGTGPFRLKAYQPGTSLSLERNPAYWEPELPYLDGIEAIFVPDDTARTGALIQGVVDFIEYVPLRDVDRLGITDGVHLAGDALNNVRYLTINLLREPFSDLRVRQAIAAVIDRTPILETAVFGHGVAIDTVFAPNYWAGYEHELPEPDLASAKALLTAAGYPDGFKTTLITYAPYSFLTNAAIVVQEQLKQLGIEIDYSAYDVATTSQMLVEHQFDLAIGSTTAWVDPHPVVLGNFGTGQLGNATSFSDPRVDELIREGRLEIERSKRTAIYRELQEIVKMELPWVPLYSSNQYEAMTDRVRDFVHYPTGSNAALRFTWIG